MEANMASLGVESMGLIFVGSRGEKLLDVRWWIRSLRRFLI
jgi:hypothetical protein